MMWGTWLFWILVGGLVLFMFTRGGCCGHAGHGGSRDDGGDVARGGTASKKGEGGETSRKPAHGGCH